MSPSPDSAAVVAAARGWIGTPWRHQHRLRGYGVDCIGLVIAAGIEAAAFTDPGPSFDPWKGYARTPNPARMRAGLETFLVPILFVEARDGDIAWIAWREAAHLPMHLAIRASLEGRPTLIHATERAGAVVEHGLTGEWPGLIHSWWRFPRLAAGGL